MSQCLGVLPGSESHGKNKKRPGDRKPVAGAFVFCKCVIKVYTRKAKRALQLALQRSFLWCGRWDLNPGSSHQLLFHCSFDRTSIRFLAVSSYAVSGTFLSLKYNVREKVRYGYALFSSRRKTPLTAWAVFSASPVRVCPYIPNVSMSSLWPTRGLISPAGNVLTTETKVWRSS